MGDESPCWWYSRCWASRRRRLVPVAAWETEEFGLRLRKTTCSYPCSQQNGARWTRGERSQGHIRGGFDFRGHRSKEAHRPALLRYSIQSHHSKTFRAQCPEG